MTRDFKTIGGIHVYPRCSGSRGCGGTGRECLVCYSSSSLPVKRIHPDWDDLFVSSSPADVGVEVSMNLLLLRDKRYRLWSFNLINWLRLRDAPEVVTAHFKEPPSHRPNPSPSLPSLYNFWNYLIWCYIQRAENLCFSTVPGRKWRCDVIKPKRYNLHLSQTHKVHGKK